jgi:hypothetical protein
VDLEFHYKAIRALTRLAGFADDESRTIAYASQYVDDCSEHKPILVDGLPEFAAPCIKNGRFDPTCTVHSSDRAWFGLVDPKYKLFLAEKAQRLILLPFHFLPTIGEDGAIDYRVRADGRLGRALVRRAVDALNADAPGEREGCLVALGVALHSYADTWAHEGFSGRFCERENAIRDVEAQDEDGGWGHPFAAGWDVIPALGHTQALGLPDEIPATWRAFHEGDNDPIDRVNYAHFRPAVEAIYRFLLSCNGRAEQGRDLDTQVRQDLVAVMGGSSTWEERFCALGLRFDDYDQFEWRSESLEGDDVDWEGLETREEFARLHFAFRGGRARWVYFHRAARAQRDFVAGHLPPNIASHATRDVAELARWRDRLGV